MNDAKLIPAKLIISLLIPLLVVTLVGIFIYQSPSAFFYASEGAAATESNGPAVIYYALTLAIALMFFLMQQGYKGYEIIAFGLLTLVYSLSLKRMTPGVFRPIHIYMIPLLVFFFVAWLVLKFIFFNRKVHAMRLILFSVLNSVAFTLAFWIQHQFLKLPTDGAFLQSRFVSGLMLFIAMGLGLSIAQNIMVRLDYKFANKQKQDIVSQTDADSSADEAKD
ncbi:MAG: hypothetical protein R6V77_08005 [Candidatus Cloacimonadaceae bacterium]